MKKNFPYRKVLIVGCGGAGKSTLAVEMSKRFNLPAVHLDKLWWLSGWVTRSEQEFDALLACELVKSDWIIEGNFYRTFETRLQYADFCVFLDYDTQLCVKSVYERADKYKGTTRPDMTDGCIERVDGEFENWILSFREKVRPLMLSKLQSGSTPYKVFKTREETANWLYGYLDLRQNNTN